MSFLGMTSVPMNRTWFMKSNRTTPGYGPGGEALTGPRYHAPS